MANWSDTMATREVDSNVFPAGTYVVLLTTCNGEENVWRNFYKVGYCYKLRKPSNTFTFLTEKDNKGSTSNGWSTSKESAEECNAKLKLRLASDQEITEYERLGKPYDVNKMSQIINNYQIC